ncbi:carotenoid 1,2-hydratase [Phaeovibrio sulfidiphilus]|nr:carotenoid 1,2-hydratase [Phaeovibrio sulfidiphilus]
MMPLFCPEATTFTDSAPDFTLPVPPEGYAWWYMDAVSDDGRHALTVIAFVGSVFSPYYAVTGRRNPANHCAMNVALYGDHSGWAMTERGSRELERSPERIVIGPSSMTLDATGLTIHLDERTFPLPGRIRGRIRLEATHISPNAYPIDEAGRHIWRPVILNGRVSVELDHPRPIRWEGTGYMDSNRGDEPLFRAFRRWDWYRADLPDGSVGLVYDVEAREGRGKDILLALKAPPGGGLENACVSERIPLKNGRHWRIRRAIRTDGGAVPSVDRFLEDTPFYTRSEVHAPLFGQEARIVHESMDLDRLASRWVPFLLPFRMPRRP